MAQTSATCLRILHNNGRLYGCNHQMSANTMTSVVQMQNVLQGKITRQNAPA
uniref:Kik1 n=1 Tax=Arundo donax TaxID=35708 RepID=A0A0A9GLI2_ARUDO